MKIFRIIAGLIFIGIAIQALSQDKCISSSLQIKKHIEVFSKSLRGHLDNDPGKHVFSNKDRIQKGMNEVDLTIPFFSDNKVESWVNFYAVEEKENFQAILSVFSLYERVFDEKLKEYSLPSELKYLPIVLSALNKTAISENGRVGIWQIPYLRGRLQGINISEHIDERRLVEKSTAYAVKHLSVLYKKYNDWHMAIAEYVSGPAAVNKALMVKQKGELIYHYLPEESTDYLPAYMAVLYLIHNQKQHKIESAESIVQIETQSLLLQRKVHAEAIAKVLTLNKGDVLNLNPVYRTDYLLPEGEYNKLFLPEGMVNKVSSNWEKIYFLTDSVIAPPLKKIEVPKASYVYNQPVTDPLPPDNTEMIIHKVKAGEVLGQIAEKYGVGLSKVKRWNALKSSRIYVGQKLKIYVPKGTGNKFKDENSKNTLKPGHYTLYEVKSGDSLWSISRKYSGVSPEDIMRWNGIDTNLHPGQKLKIKK